MNSLVTNRGHCLATLLLFLIGMSNGFWCAEDCECIRRENEYGDNEYQCTRPEIELNVIENQGQYSMICESLYLDDVEDGSGDSETKQKFLEDYVVGFHLRFGNVDTLEIVDCSSPRSYDRLFEALGVTKVAELVLENLSSSPVVLESNSFHGEIFKNVESLVLRYRGFTIESTSAFRYFENLKNLEITDARINVLPDFTTLKNLENLRLYKIPSLSLKNESFRGLINLKNLSLSSNGIKILPYNLMHPLVNLRVCKLSANFFEEVPENFFAHNKLLKEIVWYQDFNAECYYRGGICQRIFNKDLLGDCNSLTSFYYSSSNPRIKVIFNPDLFSRCNFLETLHITESGLTSEDLRALNLTIFPNLKKLVLYKNNISHLENRFIPRHLNVNLGNNPLNCSDCETLGTYFTLDKVIDNVRCKSENNFTGFAYAWTLNNCSLHTTTRIHTFPSHLYILIGVGGIIVIVIVILTSLILTSQNLRVWLYNHTFWSIFFQNETDENIKYDAFISYAEEDCEYIRNVLLPGLEEGHRKNEKCNHERVYKCCDHRRDWIVGEEIVDNIINSVEMSSRTIVVLSRHFLNSSWAQMEFDEAYIKRKVIMIFRGRLEHIKDRLEHFLSIKHYVETFTYLEEDDPLFWQKLTYLLPHRKMKKKNTCTIEKRHKVQTSILPRQRHPTELRELVRNVSEEYYS